MFEKLPAGEVGRLTGAPPGTSRGVAGAVVAGTAAVAGIHCPGCFSGWQLSRWAVIARAIGVEAVDAGGSDCLGKIAGGNGCMGN